MTFSKCSNFEKDLKESLKKKRKKNPFDEIA